MERENNALCVVMELFYGSSKISALRRRSVHNQRTQRAWVDLWNEVSNLLYDIFHFLEPRGGWTLRTTPTSGRCTACYYRH